ncbi:MAG: di-trans,poly-cis-decaprenylcistransferase [Candidatus Sungbacteria bacterium]|nr:di-trans,poly-cis-decaprenylcistransferase [Candidatus Sungbacteria bacterium]
MASSEREFPQAVFIVPDGNRRYARRRGFPQWAGHRTGFEIFKKIFDAAWEYDIKHLVFWALSYENLERRSEIELQYLYLLLREAIVEVEKKLRNDARGIQFRAIGEWRTKLPEKLASDIRALEYKTAQNNQRVFALLLAYDGVRDICSAIGQLPPNGEMFNNSFTSEKLLRTCLTSGCIPNVDLYIRTGCEGDPHLSGGALMLQMANAQLSFTETLWPDFTTEEFDAIMQNYARRERRMGA